MDHKGMIQTLKRSLRTTFLTPFTHRDQQDWKTFVSTTLWQTMIGRAKMLMETGSTRNSRNVVFQTTSSLTQKRKHREKTTTTLWYFSLFLFEQRVVCFLTLKELRKHSTGWWIQIALPTMPDCRCWKHSLMSRRSMKQDMLIMKRRSAMTNHSWWERQKQPWMTSLTWTSTHPLISL